MSGVVSLSSLQNTPPLSGQECFLYTVLLRQDLFDNSPQENPEDKGKEESTADAQDDVKKAKERFKKNANGIIGMIKIISFSDDIKKLQADYARIDETNKDMEILWGSTGEWTVLRDPNTDTEGTIDLVKTKFDDEEWMGEKLSNGEDAPPKELKKTELKPSQEIEEFKARLEIDHYKQKAEMEEMQKRRNENRKKALDELSKKMDDPTTISSYTTLQWKRLQAKSTIAEYQAKVDEATAILVKTVKELNHRDRMFPHYKKKWMTEARRIQALSNPGQAESEPIERIVKDLESKGDDDAMISKSKVKIDDNYDEGIGVEAKGTGKINDTMENDYVDNTTPEAREKALREMKEAEERVKSSFLENTSNVKELKNHGKKPKKKKSKDGKKKKAKKSDK